MLLTFHYHHQHQKKKAMKAIELLLLALVCKSILGKKLFGYNMNQNTRGKCYLLEAQNYFIPISSIRINNVSWLNKMSNVTIPLVIADQKYDIV